MTSLADRRRTVWFEIEQPLRDVCYRLGPCAPICRRTPYNKSLCEQAELARIEAGQGTEQYRRQELADAALPWSPETDTVPVEPDPWREHQDEWGAAANGTL